MKTAVVILMMLVLLSATALAADTGPLRSTSTAKPVTSNVATTTTIYTASAGVGGNGTKPALVREGEAAQAVVKNARNVTELKEIISARTNQLNKELDALEKREQNVYQNQNRVRIAVSTLLAMENLTGGIGKNVSAIAREFNNSVKNTTALELKIQERSAIVKFFLGNERSAVAELEATLNQTAERLEALKQIKEVCNCTDELKAILQEQIASMETEQARLTQLVNSEKRNTGILGWLFK